MQPRTSLQRVNPVHERWVLVLSCCTVRYLSVFEASGILLSRFGGSVFVWLVQLKGAVDDRVYDGVNLFFVCSHLH